jgi:tetrahydromethanopterin S-methyltransferase subunit B
MFDALAIPPRMLLRALDDLHKLSGQLGELVESTRVLPRTEDELSANIVLLREDIQELNALLRPLIAALAPIPVELRDLDQTAEALERSMVQLQALLKKLPGV